MCYCNHSIRTPQCDSPLCYPPAGNNKKLAVKLLDEKIDIHHNMIKLERFLANPENTREIDSRELELMYAQLDGMKAYYNALNHRAYFHANQKWPDE
tara:strand:- start:40 stop:330 length:291 start_codon:yes stop_codon:yes gene_type:complete